MCILEYLKCGTEVGSTVGLYISSRNTFQKTFLKTNWLSKEISTFVIKINFVTLYAEADFFSASVKNLKFLCTV